ncbi:MAG: AsmA family protein, partial [Candidatus Binatia bacterium]
MKKLLKLCGFAAATFVLLVTITALAFYHLIRVGEFRRFLISELERQTDFKVQLGEADLDIGLISGIGFRNLALSDPAAAQPAITAERITVRVALLPLLQRSIVFNEVVLLRPSAQMVRDREGRIALLDKLFNLPLLKQQNSEFQFDLRALRIRKAEIQLIDQKTDGEAVTFRIRDADIDIDRVRGQQLRKFMQDLLKVAPKEPRGPALQFSLKSIVEKDGNRANLRGKGRLISLNDALDLRSAWWSVDVDLVDIPASLLRQYAARHVAVKSMTGHVAQQMHIEGRPSENLRVSGDIEFRQFGVDAPELFAAPLTVGDGRASFVAQWSPHRIALSQLNFRSNDIKFSVQGEIRSLASNDPHFQLNLSSLPMPITVLRKLIPFKFIA